MLSTLQSVKLMQNTHLHVKPVGAAEGIGEANREDMGAGWLAGAVAAGAAGVLAGVLAGAGVAVRTKKNLKNDCQTFISIYFRVLCNTPAGLIPKLIPAAATGAGAEAPRVRPEDFR